MQYGQAYQNLSFSKCTDWPKFEKKLIKEQGFYEIDDQTSPIQLTQTSAIVCSKLQPFAILKPQMPLLTSLIFGYFSLGKVVCIDLLDRCYLLYKDCLFFNSLVSSNEYFIKWLLYQKIDKFGTDWVKLGGLIHDRAELVDFEQLKYIHIWKLVGPKTKDFEDRPLLSERRIELRL